MSLILHVINYFNFLLDKRNIGCPYLSSFRRNKLAVDVQGIPYITSSQKYSILSALYQALDGSFSAMSSASAMLYA